MTAEPDGAETTGARDGADDAPRGGPLRAGAILFACALVAVAAVVAIDVATMRVAPSYARVGPRLFPNLIAAGLALAAFGFGWAAWRRGVERVALDPGPIGWIAGGLAAQLLLIPWIGFMLATPVLFAATARGFGSRRPWRDLAIGLLLCAVVQIAFTYGLRLRLPFGRLAGLWG